MKILNEISFNDQGLVPVIAQDYKNGDVLMMAWMNEEAVKQTLQTNKVCYFSRSRGKLWFKGETSGQTQELKEFLIDCDSDTILVKIKQTGVACHTGRRCCFYKKIENDEITINQKIITNPDELYKK